MKRSNAEHRHDLSPPVTSVKKKTSTSKKSLPAVSKKSAAVAVTVADHASPRCTSILILDSGGWTVKHGLCGRMKAPQQVPNAIARLKHQLATLVADEIETRVKNKSQLEVTRPYERGYCTNLYCLLQVWTRIVVDLYGISIPADHACVVLLTPPFTPTVLDDAIDQTVFTDLGFGRCIKLLLPSMAAYRYLHHTNSTGNTSKNRTEENGTTTNVLAPFSLDGTQCCCVVDSGFSFTHVVPTVNTKAVVRDKVIMISLP
jgi:actin-related protein 6